MMNERGNIILIVLILMGLIVFGLPLVMYFSESVNLIVRILLIFAIIMTVRGYLGSGVLMLIVSGVLIYFLAFKWWWVGASGLFAMTLLTMGFFGIIVWGTSKVVPSGR